MDRSDRAKQFMPFDALKGFREALKEREKVFVPKRVLSEEQLEELDRKLSMVKKGDVVTVEYFCNGEYVRVTGKVTDVDGMDKSIKIANTKLDLSEIYELSGWIFEGFETK